MQPQTVSLRLASMLVALGWLAAGPLTAGTTETGYGLGLDSGFDSNPLLVRGDGPSGTFVNLRLDGGVTQYLGSGSTAALFIDGRVALREDESRTADAGHDSGDARAGVVLAPSGRRLLVSLGGRASMYRGTFTDRETGAVYTTAVVPATDPPSTLPIPERLDFDGAGAFLNLRLKASRRSSVSLEAALDRADYVEDYGALTGLDSLDYRSLTLRPGARLQLGDAATLGLGIALTDLEYDDRLALDRNGAEVQGTRRTYHYSQYELALRVKPSAPWNLDLGLTAGERQDTHAGYYDSASATGYVGVDRSLGASSKIRAVASVRTLEYDHATVTGDPLDDLQASDEQRYLARFSREFGQRWSWHVEGGTVRADSRDPAFAYDRDWMLTGFRFGR